MSTIQVYVSRKGEPIEAAAKLKDAEQVRVRTNIDGQPFLELAFPGNERVAFDLNCYDFWILPKECDV